MNLAFSVSVTRCWLEQMTTVCGQKEMQKKSVHTAPWSTNCWKLANWSLPSRRTKLAPVCCWRRHHVPQQLLPSRICHKYVAEGTTILSTPKQTITIAILSLDCYIKTYINCLINSFFLYTLYKLRFDNFFIKRRWWWWWWWWKRWWVKKKEVYATLS